MSMMRSPKKAAEQQKVQNDIDAFLNTGGSIAEIPQGATGLLKKPAKKGKSNNTMGNIKPETRCVGKPCGKCGSTERYKTGNGCVPCKSEENKKAKKRREAERG